MLENVHEMYIIGEEKKKDERNVVVYFYTSLKCKL